MSSVRAHRAGPRTYTDFQSRTNGATAIAREELANAETDCVGVMTRQVVLRRNGGGGLLILARILAVYKKLYGALDCEEACAF